MSKAMSALDEAMAILPAKMVVLPPRGFTRADAAKRMGVPETTMRKMLNASVAEGKMAEIGVRPGRGGARVFEVVKPKGGRR
jgi:predicted DNA-binding protein (UPF0251 family)